MDESIKAMLSEEIASEIESISQMLPGSDEHAAAVEDLVKLYKLGIEEAKIELDTDEKRRRRVMDKEHHNADNELEQRQLEERVKDRYFRFGAEVAGIVLPLAFYAFWMNRGFKFEETGTFTSKTFKDLIGCFKPKK